jgi:hypothetical protein
MFPGTRLRAGVTVASSRQVSQACKPPAGIHRARGLLLDSQCTVGTMRCARISTRTSYTPMKVLLVAILGTVLGLGGIAALVWTVRSGSTDIRRAADTPTESPDAGARMVAPQVLPHETVMTFGSPGDGPGQFRGPFSHNASPTPTRQCAPGLTGSSHRITERGPCAGDGGQGAKGACAASATARRGASGRHRRRPAFGRPQAPVARG